MLKELEKNLKKLTLIFQLLKQDMGVDIDGMLANVQSYS
jgi:hypothetical protein